MSDPHTLEEWQDYIDTLSGPELRSKALAANHLSFVQQMQEEGLPAPAITGIFKAFAMRFVADSQEPPGIIPEGYVNYSRLALDG